MGGKSPLSHSKSKETKIVVYDTAEFFEFLIPVDVDPVAFMTSPEFVELCAEAIRTNNMAFKYVQSLRRN